MTTGKTVITVTNANFHSLAIYHNILVKIPTPGSRAEPGKDQFFKFIKAHDTSVNGQIIHIPNRYRRGDKVSGEWVTKYFTVDSKHFGKKVIATVELVEKTDHNQNDKKTFILNITPIEPTARPTLKLRIGVNKRCKNNSAQLFQIPNTDKYIGFEPIG